uniref:Pre-mRNA-splicing factor SYF2 n=1 Tax=Cafeteria roenbergensis TaxID=33653 RepID=A0A7S0JVS0_CAFRO|mmetsp:Transcript_19306/g.74018  ORF Transcript_19306/g.74018 Transcript_19306/m.74018 type:complete len:404 (+) Transcript_19306:731-1942(+)
MPAPTSASRPGRAWKPSTTMAASLRKGMLFTTMSEMAPASAPSASTTRATATAQRPSRAMTYPAAPNTSMAAPNPQVTPMVSAASPLPGKKASPAVRYSPNITPSSPAHACTSASTAKKSGKAMLAKDLAAGADSAAASRSPPAGAASHWVVCWLACAAAPLSLGAASSAAAAAAAPAPAPAPSAKVSAAQARLAALRDRAKAGRRETSKEAYFEARRGAGLDTERMRAGKRRRDEAAGGEERDVADAVLDLDASTAREAAYKEEIKAKRAREHFGWAQHNGRMEREYARDVAALPAGSAAALAAAASGEASAGRVAEAVVPHLASDSRHGAADFADPARVEALAGRIEGKISSGVGRTRKVRQDEAPTYINDRNRRMNLMLERHYGKFAAETKESFERGTAL